MTAPSMAHWPVHESRDGVGAGDHDQPYTFGHRPCTAAPFPFSTRELARLMILRGRTQNERLKALHA